LLTLHAFPTRRSSDLKYFSISPGYLKAAGTHLLTGRDFTWYDDANTPKVAIINDSFARAMFGKTSALGLRFVMADKVSYEIVGVDRKSTRLNSSHVAI